MAGFRSDGNEISYSWSALSSWVRILNKWLENLELAVGVISRQPLTAEAWFQTQSFLCGLCGRQIDTGAGFSPGTSVFPCQYHCTFAPYSITDLTTDAAEFS